MRSRAFLLCVILALLLSCRKDESPARDFITIAVPYEFDTLDPQARNTVSNFAILSHFYEPLVQTDASMKIHPCLARLWENPDLLTWIFYLEPKAKFHDGKPLTSDDVVYSFHRLLENPSLEISGYLTDISDVTAVGPHAVRVHTVRPMNILLNKLRFVPIVSGNAATQSIETKTNGTGPYLLLDWKKGESIRMVRNENYWGTKPPIREVLFLLAQSPETALKAFLGGKCEFAQCNTKLLESQKRSFQILKSDSLFVKFVGYDLLREQTPFCDVKPNPFKNKLVRKAIFLALNRNELVSKLSIYASPATQPLPPFVFGFNPRIPQAAYDPKQAASLLQQAGFPDGFAVTLHFRSNLAEAAAIIREQLARIGIRMEVKTLPTPELLPALKNHEYSFFLASMGAPSGDASDILDPALHSPDLARRYGALNYGGYSNPEVDRAIEQSAQILLMDTRRDAIQKIMETVMEDLPWIPIYIDQDVYALDNGYTWKPRNDSFIFAPEIGISQ